MVRYINCWNSEGNFGSFHLASIKESKLITVRINMKEVVYGDLPTIGKQ